MRCLFGRQWICIVIISFIMRLGEQQEETSGASGEGDSQAAGSWYQLPSWPLWDWTAQANKMQSMLLQWGTLLNRAEPELDFRSLCRLTQQCTILGIDPEEISRSMAEIYIQGRPVHHCHSPHLGSEPGSRTCLDTRGFMSKMVLRSRRERVGEGEGISYNEVDALGYWGSTPLHPRTGCCRIYFPVLSPMAWVLPGAGEPTLSHLLSGSFSIRKSSLLAWAGAVSTGKSGLPWRVTMAGGAATRGRPRNRALGPSGVTVAQSLNTQNVPDRRLWINWYRFIQWHTFVITNDYNVCMFLLT